MTILTVMFLCVCVCVCVDEQIRPDGFYTSVNGIFLTVYPHRSDITRYKCVVGCACVLMWGDIF
jgi:hypothetical protein